MAEPIARKIPRMLLGGFLGLAGYCALTMLEELPDLIFRGYYDWESVVKQCVLPIGPLEIFPLFSEDYWAGIPLWVNLNALSGAALILLGVWVGARWKPFPRKIHRTFLGGFFGLLAYAALTTLIAGFQYSKTRSQEIPVWSNLETTVGVVVLLIGIWLGARWKPDSHKAQPSNNAE